MRLFRQLALLAVSRARFSAGSSIAARMAIIAITTRSSISVNLLIAVCSDFLSPPVFPRVQKLLADSGRALFSIYKNIFRAGFLVTENSNVFYTQGLPSFPLSAIMVCGI